MLKFFYTGSHHDIIPIGDVPPPEDNDKLLANALAFQTAMYVFADKYAIPALARLCVGEYQRMADNLATPAQVLETIPAIYENTPEGDQGLRCAAIDALVFQLQVTYELENEFTEHLLRLMDDDRCFRKDLTLRLLRETGNPGELVQEVAYSRPSSSGMRSSSSPNFPSLSVDARGFQARGERNLVF